LKIQELEIPGLILITPDIYHDERGFFLETFRTDSYKEILGVEFVQDNMSLSRYGTIRGLHFQKAPHDQAKLVRCVYGMVLDVALDIRLGSPSFGKYASVILSGENQAQFIIPKGFAHGFSVLTQEAIVEYKCDAAYAPEAESGIRYCDPDLNIEWQIPEGKEIVSGKDSLLPLLSELTKGNTNDTGI